MLKKLMVGVLTTAIVAGGASMAVAGSGEDDGEDDGDRIRVSARFADDGRSTCRRAASGWGTSSCHPRSELHVEPVSEDEERLTFELD